MNNAKLSWGVLTSQVLVGGLVAPVRAPRARLQRPRQRRRPRYHAERPGSFAKTWVENTTLGNLWLACLS